MPLIAGRTEYLTVTDEVEQGFTIKKIDAQNRASLQGAVFVFEQIDGAYKTTGTTGFDGTISFQGDELPYGSYRVWEQSAPQGYQKETRVETVKWDGPRDVTLTFENVRDIGLTIVKKDAYTGVSLPNAAFDMYASVFSVKWGLPRSSKDNAATTFAFSVPRLRFSCCWAAKVRIIKFDACPGTQNRTPETTASAAYGSFAAQSLP